MGRRSVLLVLCLRLAGCGAVRIVHPAEDAVLQYVPDIPLWVRLEREQGECFDIRLNGESATISCEEDTILDAWPKPGEHRLEIVPTFKPSTRGPMATSIFHVVGFGDRATKIPQWMASHDGYDRSCNLMSVVRQGRCTLHSSFFACVRP